MRSHAECDDWRMQLSDHTAKVAGFVVAGLPGWLVLHDHVPVPFDFVTRQALTSLAPSDR